MDYRIRYRIAGESAEREAVVNAGSPSEALVRFRHRLAGGGEGHEVLSISPEPVFGSLAW